MSLPPWLFDQLAGATPDNAELRARAIAWDGLLAGAEEAASHPEGERHPVPALDFDRYRQLRYRGVPYAAFYQQQRVDFWRPIIPTPAADETYYARPRTAATITGLSTSALAAMRRRGELRSVGMTAGEYKRAREAAGWVASDHGWGPGVWYLREDIERLALNRRRGTA